MRKILSGFIVALAIGIPAAYFGMPWWAEHKAVQELDATIEMLRRTGAKASRGAISYDPWRRTLKVTDLSIQLADPAKGTLKIRQLTANGIANVDAAKFSAERIDIEDAEVNGLQTGAASPMQNYKIPKLSAESFTGPIFQSGDQQNALAALSASKISIPTVSLALRGSAATTLATYDLAGVEIRKLQGDAIESVLANRFNFKTQLPGASAYNVDVEAVEISDIDVGAMLSAMFWTQNKDDNFRRVYRQTKTGPWTMTMGGTATMRMASTQVDDFAVRPSRFSDRIFSLADKLAAQQAGAPLSETEARELMEKIATLYEGFRLAQIELRDFSSTMDANTLAKIGSIKLVGIDGGKIRELAVENAVFTPPSGDPASLERLTFKGIDFVKLMRTMAQVGVDPSLGFEQGLGLLSAVGGLEVRNFKGVERTTMQPLQVETFDLSWGQFINAIPSQIRAATKFTAVVDPSGTDPNLRYLVDAGIKDITVDFDFGAAWNENTKMIAARPITLTVSNVIGLSANAILSNVSETTFSPNPMLFGMSAAQIEAGPVEITVKDLGIVDMVIAQQAQDQGVAPEIMRVRFVEMIRAVSQASPELETIGAALARLVQNRGAALTVQLTPKARVNLMQAFEIAGTDPLAFLSQFKVDARTDR